MKCAQKLGTESVTMSGWAGGVLRWLVTVSLVLGLCAVGLADGTVRSPSRGGLPSQAGNAGKFLTTNGSIASWATAARKSSTFKSLVPPPNGNAYTVPAGGAVMAIPVWVPSDVTSVVVHMQNIDLDTSGSDVTGVNLAVGKSDAAGNFASAPTQYSSITVPHYGPYVSPSIPITRGTDGKVMVAVGVPAGAVAVGTNATSITGRFTTGTTTVYPLTGVVSTVTQTMFLIQLEYTTTAKRVVVIGDSIPAGFHYSYDVPGTGSVAELKLSYDYGYAVYIDAFPATRIYTFIDPTQMAVFETQSQLANVVAGAIVIVEAGINDTPYASNYSTSEYQGFAYMVYDLVRTLRAMGASYILFETLSPCAAYEPTYSANRVNFNKWILGKPFGIDGVVDRASRLSTSGTATTTGDTLKAAYDIGAADGCHPDDAGQTALEAEIYNQIKNY